MQQELLVPDHLAAHGADEDRELRTSPSNSSPMATRRSAFVREHTGDRANRQRGGGEGRRSEVLSHNADRPGSLAGPYAAELEGVPLKRW